MALFEMLKATEGAGCRKFLSSKYYPKGVVSKFENRFCAEVYA